MTYTIETQNEYETKQIAHSLAKILQGGEVLCLKGELGTGKTTFVQGIADGLSVTEQVISPTFILVREYKGHLPLFHVDAYRLQGLSQKEIQQQIGLSDYMEKGGVVAIEWADLIANALPKERLEICFEYTPKGRKLSFKPYGQRYKDFLSCYVKSLLQVLPTV